MLIYNPSVRVRVRVRVNPNPKLEAGHVMLIYIPHRFSGICAKKVWS